MSNEYNKTIGQNHKAIAGSVTIADGATASDPITVGAYKLGAIKLSNFDGTVLHIEADFGDGAWTDLYLDDASGTQVALTGLVDGRGYVMDRFVSAFASALRIRIVATTTQTGDATIYFTLAA